ncbi:hypothetical protein AVEN_21823-1 [Araneus ventricosus]|uniref:CCHC-type domain-containing protein n=1 Tax=Araneus ventricosus TaxID=182803 RepID=A0A4Y2P0K3_ARAVE|nr:hypothetical protein AVEN_21823-1 [Araneus ventricosus]
MKIEDGKSEFKGEIEEVEQKVQGKIGDIERRLSELEDRPFSFSASPEFMHPRPTIKSLTFDGQTSWTMFKSQFEVNWPENKKIESRRKPSRIGCRCGKTNEPGHAECPLDVREILAAQYFVDAIRDEDTQHSTRLMDAKDMKSSLAYSMKCEAARTVSKTSRHVRSIETEDHTSRKRYNKFEFYFNRLEKLLNSSVAGEKIIPLRNSNMTCLKCNKNGHVQRECQAITSKQEN